MAATGGQSGSPVLSGSGRIVAFLCSQPAAFLSGAALNVDGATVQGLL